MSSGIGSRTAAEVALFGVYRQHLAAGVATKHPVLTIGGAGGLDLTGLRFYRFELLHSPS
jgi:hypothetical protein